MVEFNPDEVGRDWFRGEIRVWPTNDANNQKPIAYWETLVIENEGITCLVNSLRIPMSDAVNIYEQFQNGEDTAAALSRMFAAMKGEFFRVEVYLGDEPQIVWSIEACLTEWIDKGNGDNIEARLVPTTARRLDATDQRLSSLEDRMTAIEANLPREAS